MRYNEFKLILLEMAADAVDSLKQALATQIRTLPSDDQSIKTLREIEDLLRDVNAGGFKGLIKRDLLSIDDKDVTAAQKELAMYILNLDSTPEQRKELFNLWRSDNLINKDALFSGDDMTFDEIFNGYSTNPMVAELVDTLMSISALGQGKGEFALSVFSKHINKPTDGKGDLIAHHNGKLLHVEVKTSDKATTIDPDTGAETVKTSSARFGDQEVGVSDEWVEHAKDLNNYVRGTGEYAKRKGPKMPVPGSGINISKAIDVYMSLDSKEQAVFSKKLENVVKAIFGRVGEIQRPQYLKSLKNNIKGIMDGIQAGNYNAAKQSYVNASFNYYMAKKKDDGVLFLDLPNKTAVWYNSAESLREKGLRLDAKTIFLTGTNDPTRTAYPQVYVVPTTFGGDAAQRNIKKIVKGKNPIQQPDFGNSLSKWIMKLAADRNIKNKALLEKITKATYALISQRVPTEQILPSLEQQFPELQVPVARTVRNAQAKQQTAAAPPAPAPAPAAAPAVAQPAAPV